VPKAKGKQLPFSGDFSAGIIPDLGRLLEFVQKAGGDRETVREGIRQEYFSLSGKRHKEAAQQLKQQKTRAYNVTLAMQAYGLLDGEGQRLTPFGTELLRLDSPEKRSEAFARHLLLNCDGIKVLDAVRLLQRRGTKPTKRELANTLRGVFGYDMPRATTRHTAILGFLEEAGLVGGHETDYAIDEERFAELTGARQEVREDWERLTPDQKHFVLTLRFLSPTHGGEWLPARDVYEQANDRYGLQAPDDQLARLIFAPLEEAGWLERPERGGGRGGKSGRVRATDKLLGLRLETVAVESRPLIPADLLPRLQEPLERIRANLKSRDKGTKGIALELLALRMTIDLGLTPKGFRLRSAQTGGAEIDLSAEGAHLLFSRWTVQCKNTPKVNLADLAKEVGMATLLKAHVVVMVTTGEFSSTVETLAREVASTTPLQVVLVRASIVEQYLASHERSIGVLADYFRTAATETMRLKDPQREAALREAARDTPA
jgi:hypothetical protein